MPKIKPVYEKEILAVKKKFISIAEKEIFEIESEFAIQRLNKFKKFDSDSIKQSFMNVAFTGVTLNPIFQEAYLIERDGKCFLDLTYRGLIKVATLEGAIISLSAGVVYNWDEIKFKEGTKSFLDITRNLNPPHDPEEVARNPKMIWEHLHCAYSLATFPNGMQDFIVLPKFKILKTWNTTDKSVINELWPEEWIRKTAIKYHSKTLPKAQRLVTAVSILNEHEGIKKNKKSESVLMKRMRRK